ncbi:MAG: hypothetical protein ACR2LT_03390 [Pyrinomonadaceae bacterium]
MENRELFEDYEITGWQISPKTYKFLGIAAALNLFAFIIIGQFNLLQTKACDSPYIGKVCEVLDVVALGSTLAGTDTEFADKDYDPTKIEESDITYIDVSGQEPTFTYPEGYFAVANPPDAAGLPPMDSNGFPMNGANNPSPLDMPQILPTPNDKVANQPLPDSPFSFGDAVKSPPVRMRVPNYNPRYPVKNPKSPKIKNDSPAKVPKLDGEETANANTNSANNPANTTIAGANSNNANSSAKHPAAEEDTGKFNSKPLKDFGDKYGNQILKKQVDINAPFTIEVIGRLDETGKLINAQMKNSADSDPKMSEVAKEAIAAFSDTHLLKPLYDVGGRDVKITFSQNKDNLQAIIQTETKSESNAKSIQSLLNLFIKNSPSFMRKDSDESKLLSKAELNTQGKTFIINFLMSNEEKNQLIEKNLKSLEEKKSQPQPNSVAANDKNSNAK